MSRPRTSDGRRFAPPLLSGVLLVLLSLLLPAAHAATLHARLDRDSVALGETVRLVLEAQGRFSSAAPDLTPLRKDFQVLGQSQSTSLRMGSGATASSTRWVIDLNPRHSGRITVPPLHVGSLVSHPLVLNVVVAPTGQDAAGRDIWLDAKVTPGRHYVQGQVTYVVKLYATIGILSGGISEPAPRRTTVQRLGDDVSYTATRGGRRYHVIERRFALFPQTSGKLVIPPVAFTGRVTGSGQGLSSLGAVFGGGRSVRVTSPGVQVQVLPRPAAFTGGTWLPARSLTLTEHWTHEPPSLRVGEPLTRTIRIEAHGLTGAQLPQPPTPSLPGVKVYPDQPVVKTGHDGGSVTGSVVERLALMPVTPGKVTLPALRIAWWDVKAMRQREAVLPARTLTVRPAPNGASTGTGAMPLPGTPYTQATGAGAAPARWAVLPWAGVSAALFVLWVATLAAWWRARRRAVPVTRHDVEPEPAAAARLGDAREKLRRACAVHDGSAAHAALMAFAAAAWPERSPRGLGELAARTGDGDLARELALLERALYAPGAHEWDGDALWVCARRALRPPARESRVVAPADALPPLYPPRATG